MPVGSRGTIAAVAAWALLAGTVATAQTRLPPDESRVLGRRVADAAFVDEAGRRLEVASLAGRPVVVSPIFTRCRHTCSAITRSLADALAPLGEPALDFEVLSLSFDVGDTPEDLARYRRRMGLPRGWRLARGDAAQLLPFLDSLDFRFITDTDGGFIHPNLVVVLGPDLTVSSFVYGTTFESEALAEAIQAARGGGPGPRALAPRLFAAAALGALLAAIALGVALRRIRCRARDPV